MRRSIPPFFNLPITTWKYEHNDRAAHISIESTGKIKYYHPDLRGSAKYVTDDFGNVLETRLYKPYGQEYQSSGSSGYLPYRFNDRRDETNGTLRFPLRNLSDQNYHWTALDPIIRTSPSASVKNIGNPFSYAGYDPVNNVDLLGAANIPIFRPIPLPSTEKNNEGIYVPEGQTITITAKRESAGGESSAGGGTLVAVSPEIDPFGIMSDRGLGDGDYAGDDPMLGLGAFALFAGMGIGMGGLAWGGAGALTKGALALGTRASAWMAGAGTGIASALRRVFNAAHSAAAGGAQQAINIGERGLAYVLARHFPGGAQTAGKSLFNAGETVRGLVRAAESVAPVRQLGGNFQRIVEAGRVVGADRATNLPTSIYTVITDAAGNLVTMFPGIP